MFGKINVGHISKRKHLREFGLAMEFITEQRDGFGKTLDMLFEDIRKYVVDKPSTNNADIIANCKAVKMLEEVTLKRFGLRIQILPSSDTIMAVLPMFSNKHHIFLPEHHHGNFEIDEQEILLKRWGGKTGTIDLARAKVSGVFSEYVHRFYMNPYFIYNTTNCTPEELSAVYLHEIGHLFTYYEFASRLEKTNQVLAEMSKMIKNSEDIGKINYKYQEFMTLTDSEERDAITEKTDRQVISMTLFLKYVDFVKSQLSDNKYDETSAEAAADLFSSRFGKGRDLVSALNRFESSFGVYNDENQLFALKLVVNTCDIIVFAAFIFSTMGLTTAALVPSLLLVLTTGNYIYTSGDRFVDMTYDTLKDRYKRVRAQYINILKERIYSKEETQKVLEDIYAMDDIIKNTGEFTSIGRKLSNMIFSTNRKASNSVVAQKLLEALASNDLYVNSSEFQV